MRNSPTTGSFARCNVSNELGRTTRRAALSIVLYLFGVAMLAPNAMAASDSSDSAQRYEGVAGNSAGKSDAERLRALFQIRWDYVMHEFPEFATYVGWPGENGRWTDNSIAAINRRNKDILVPIRILQTIDRQKLNDADRLNYDLFKLNLNESLEEQQFHEEYLQINQLGGVQQDVAQMMENQPQRSVADYQDILARLNGIPKLVDDTLALLAKGLEAGITPPRITLRDVPQQIHSQLIEEPEKNPMLVPFVDMPAEITADVQADLRKQAADILKDKILPAFRKLEDFMVNRYLPGARESIGLCGLPDGQARYAFCSRRSTTTDLSPKELHEIGLKEVKRIRAEMDRVISKIDFHGSFAEFCQFLRTDKQFFFTNAEDLLRAYRDIAKRADPELSKLFGKLPRLTYGVLPVPKYSEQSQTTAYYMSGSLKTGRPGYFYANTYALETRPKWEMEPLTLHEAVPGHHLQISLAQEMDEGPEFRKHMHFTAYVEGWGLYAESLGAEMGFYKDPYAKFGQLSYEMWRAIRLVVDTGIHSFGWSREQAIDYFRVNIGKSEHDIIVEVDRYIVWPGQALAYKIGELKLKELRARAVKELGEKFDIRTFHDEILFRGALPLNLLEEQVNAWILNRKNSKQ